MKNTRQNAAEVERWLRFGNPSASRQSRRSALPALMFCIWALWAPRAGALGFRVPNQDATAIGRGNAFVATADNPSAIYYNPAGLTQLSGHNFQAGSLFYLGIYGDYESHAGEDFENNPEVLALPTFQYTFTPKDSPLALGLGVYEPFGFSVDWPNDVPFRQESLEGSLTYITINPVVAWKVVPALSIAAGPTFNYSDLKLVQGILPPTSPFAPLFPDDETEFKGDDWGYGVNAGVLWQPHPKWSFGASYRSSSRLDYEGDFDLRDVPPTGQYATFSGASTIVDFPQIIIAGVSYRPTPDWNIEVNVDWADWNSVDDLKIKGAPVPVQRRLDWHDSFMYEVGVTRYLPTGYYFSLGYFFSQASTSSKYFTPMVPDTDLHIGSLGAGYRSRGWSWALAFQVIGGSYRSVNVDSSAGPTASTGSGRYRLFTPTVSFSVRYCF